MARPPHRRITCGRVPRQVHGPRVRRAPALHASWAPDPRRAKGAARQVRSDATRRLRAWKPAPTTETGERLCPAPRKRASPRVAGTLPLAQGRAPVCVRLSKLSASTLHMSRCVRAPEAGRTRPPRALKHVSARTALRHPRLRRAREVSAAACVRRAQRSAPGRSLRRAAQAARGDSLPRAHPAFAWELRRPRRAAAARQTRLSASVRAARRSRPARLTGRGTRVRSWQGTAVPSARPARGSPVTARFLRRAAPLDRRWREA